MACSAVPADGWPFSVIGLTGNSPAYDLTHAFGGHDCMADCTELSGHFQAGETLGGYYYASNRLDMVEHGSTYIDAPIHFAKGGQTLDQVPIERLIGTGVRIDVTVQCIRNRDYMITIQCRLPVGQSALCVL